MKTFTTHAYRGQEDLQVILNLLTAVRAPEHIRDYPGIVDLQEAFSLDEVQNNTRCWRDASGRLVAFAFVDPFNNLVCEYDLQAARDSRLEDEIVQWGLTCMQPVVQQSDQPVTLDASCRADNTERMAFLQKHGFIAQEVRTIHLQRALSDPIPQPQLPPGFSIRAVIGEEEVEALVALHRAAFGTENMTVEERLAMMHTPEYERELDLVAVAPDGRLAAYCMCSISAAENERSGCMQGYTDPVATHPHFQRLGLARCLLLAGLQALKARGMQFAALGTSSDNIAMLQAAHSAGFQVTSTAVWFSKPL